MKSKLIELLDKGYQAEKEFIVGQSHLNELKK